MSIPGWFPFILLALAAFRTWRLLGEDDILNRPRRYVTGLPQDWKDGDAIPKGYREWLVDFIECPYCSGAWMAFAWWGAWEIWPHGATVVAVPLALSALLPIAYRVSSQP